MSELDAPPSPRGAVTVRSRAEHLRGVLERVAHAGIHNVELSAGALDVLFQGQLHSDRMKRVIDAVNASELGISVHQPSVLDLRSNSEPEVMQQLFHSLLEMCRELGASVFVLHYEKASGDPALEAQFETLLVEGAERAEEVIIGVENIEVAPSSEVVGLVERLDHPNIRMTWDVGHDVLAADAFGYDVTEAARRAAPYVAHVHAQDNFGRYEPLRLTDREAYDRMGKVKLSALGRGDLHLPIGWGTIPWRQLLTPLREAGFAGTVVSEVLERFYEWHLDDIATGLQFALDVLTGVDEMSLQGRS